MKTAINLLPIEFRRQLMLRHRAVQWGVAVCVVVLVMWSARSWKMREYHALGEQLGVLARENRPIQAMLRETVAMREQLQKLEQQEQVAKELDQQRRVLALLGVVSRTVQRGHGKLRVTGFQLVDFQRTGSAARNPSQEPGAGSLALSGVSLDSPAVAELLDKLQNSGLFTGVELIALKERHEDGIALHDFEVRCGL